MHQNGVTRKMLIDRSEMLAGVPILKIRDFARRTKRWSLETLEEKLKLPPSQVGIVAQELFARGWARPSEYRDRDGCPHFQWTLDGSRLALARAVPRLPRETAKKLVAQLLDRVREVNARDEFTEVVQEVSVFGSFLDESKEQLGDIDLVIELRRREVPGRDWVEYSLQRAAQSGRAFKSYHSELHYGSTEVLLLLKARNRYLSFHYAEDPMSMGARTEVLFALQDRRRDEVGQQSRLVGPTGPRRCSRLERLLADRCSDTAGPVTPSATLASPR